LKYLLDPPDAFGDIPVASPSSGTVAREATVGHAEAWWGLSSMLARVGLARLAAYVLAVLVFIPVEAHAQSSRRIDVPIAIGGDKESKACWRTGQVVGLDPNQDGFLSVRSGPGRSYREMDRLYNGRQVYICDQRGRWLGIVYGWGGNCGVSIPWPIRQPYTGPWPSDGSSTGTSEISRIFWIEAASRSSAPSR